TSTMSTSYSHMTRIGALSFSLDPIRALSFFSNDTATTAIYTLSLHDALPICASPRWRGAILLPALLAVTALLPHVASADIYKYVDRKSTRLNSSHVKISYAVFCLKKKKRIYRVTGATILWSAVARIRPVAKQK